MSELYLLTMILLALQAILGSYLSSHSKDLKIIIVCRQSIKSVV